MITKSDLCIIEYLCVHSFFNNECQSLLKQERLAFELPLTAKEQWIRIFIHLWSVLNTCDQCLLYNVPLTMNIKSQYWLSDNDYRMPVQNMLVRFHLPGNEYSATSIWSILKSFLHALSVTHSIFYFSVCRS